MSYGWNRDAPSQHSTTDLADSFLNSVKQEIQEAPSYGHASQVHVKEEYVEAPYDDYRRRKRDMYGDSKSRHQGNSSSSSSHRDRYYDNSRDHRDNNKRARSRDRRDRHRSGRDSRDYRSRRRSSPSPRRSSRRSSPRARDENVIPLSKRERKLHNWDVAPAGMEGMSAQQVKSTGLFPLPGQVLGTRAPQSFQAPPPTSHHDDYRRGFPPAIPKQQKRIYVGQIPYNIGEAPLADFFNTTMKKLHLIHEPCVELVTLNHDKNYAFVDFETPEQATHAMGFDGIMFQGQQLKIRRPKDYQPPVEGTYETTQVPGLVSTNVADTPNKIFIGGLPIYLNDDQVVELLKSFGELRSFNLVKDMTTGQNKGFAFCEYIDPNVTDLACEGLNNMELGDRKLIVQRASLGAKQGTIPADYMTHVPITAADYLPISGAKDEEATRVLQLMNMITPEELEDEEEYKDIWEDIAEECSRFGNIIDMKIPKPHHGQDVPGLGSIFVRYETNEQTLAALNSLAGRKFSDRTVVATFIDEENYLSDNF